MEKALVIALPEEFDKYDLLTGVGPDNVKKTFTEFIRQNPDLKRVINYGTCGSLDEKYVGLYCITTFSNTIDNNMLGDGKGLHLISNPGFLTEKGTIQADLVDCEAYWLKEICDENDIEFLCYKYVSDYVGRNTIEEFWDNVGDGAVIFDTIYRKFL